MIEPSWRPGGRCGVPARFAGVFLICDVDVGSHCGLVSSFSTAPNADSFGSRNSDQGANLSFIEVGERFLLELDGYGRGGLSPPCEAAAFLEGAECGRQRLASGTRFPIRLVYGHLPILFGFVHVAAQSEEAGTEHGIVYVERIVSGGWASAAKFLFAGGWFVLNIC